MSQQYQSYCPICPSGVVPGLFGQVIEERSRGDSAIRAMVSGIINPLVSLATAHHARHQVPGGGISSSTINGVVLAKSGMGKSHHLRPLLKPFLDHVPEIVLDDVTPSTFLPMLAKKPIAGQFLDEGGQLLVAMRNRDLGTYIKLREGDSFTFGRSETGGLLIRNPLFSVLLMVQPDIYREFRQRLDNVLRASGYDARFLHTLVEETLGAWQQFGDGSSVVHDQYVTRLTELLTMLKDVLDSGEMPDRVNHFTPSAQSHLRDIASWFRQATLPGGALVDHSDYAAKQLGNVMRLASSWHTGNGVEGDISAEYVERASELCKYHAGVFCHLTWKPLTVSQEDQDAQVMENALWQRAYATGMVYMSHREAVDYAPNIGLTKARAKRAIDRLCWYGRTQLNTVVIDRKKVLCIILMRQQAYPQIR